MMTVKLFVFKAKPNASVSGGAELDSGQGTGNPPQLKFTPVSHLRLVSKGTCWLKGIEVT